MKNIKQISGVPCVLGKVHMLATESLGVIMSDVGPYDTDMVLISELPENLRGHERPHNHLYITTDEEIKEGDWFIWLKYNLVERATKKDNNKECRKIIATTDPKLTTNCKGCKRIIKGSPHTSLTNCTCVNKIPQQFIQDYCNNPVDEVYVEYVYENSRCVECGEYKGSNVCINKKECLKTYFGGELKLKINSNNEIIIHNVEEKMYSREQIEATWDAAVKYTEQLAFINSYQSHNEKITEPDKNKWIEENL